MSAATTLCMGCRFYSTPWGADEGLFRPAPDAFVRRMERSYLLMEGAPPEVYLASTTNMQASPEAHGSIICPGICRHMAWPQMGHT